MCHGDTEIVTLSLEVNADFNLAPKGERSPLCWAFYRDNAETVNALLQAGANTDYALKGGSSDLWQAIWCNNTYISRLLVEASANQNPPSADYMPHRLVRLLPEAGAD
ncbi:ankyrin repeat-containing domain protein [Aspergillus parasiticus]|uniref:Ankyrin repeat-containing domain protein n=1 Tax=Aspergillus parasiticus TaxID=5067 RepID=A0A5N6DWD4_ASPPA|nr:ankyrin repeat-containing domain protein [Aspergillus parasiticus]